jgi:TPR repeat protein
LVLVALIASPSATLLAVTVAPHGNLSDLARFLDAIVPADQRRSLFEAWRAAALGGDTDAQYIVGTIYRRGDSIEPHVVGRDADQARRFLSTAGGHGRLLAMARWPNSNWPKTARSKR